MPILGAGLHILIAILCGVHCVRNHRSMYWLFILFAFPLLGSAVYFFAEVMPDLRQSRGMRAVSRALDPGRALRDARQALELSPTVDNRLRLAECLLGVGQAAEAVQLYRDCLQGPYADDPKILQGLAAALLQVGDAPAALAVVEDFRSKQPETNLPALDLLHAQALAGAGRDDAGEAFERLMARSSEVELKCHYAAWLAKHGQTPRARALYEDVLATAQHWPRHARDFNRQWIEQAQAGLRSLG